MTEKSTEGTVGKTGPKLPRPQPRGAGGKDPDVSNAEASVTEKSTDGTVKETGAKLPKLQSGGAGGQVSDISEAKTSVLEKAIGPIDGTSGAKLTSEASFGIGGQDLDGDQAEVPILVFENSMDSVDLESDTQVPNQQFLVIGQQSSDIDQTNLLTTVKSTDNIDGTRSLTKLGAPTFTVSTTSLANVDKLCKAITPKKSTRGSTSKLSLSPSSKS